MRHLVLQDAEFHTEFIQEPGIRSNCRPNSTALVPLYPMRSKMAISSLSVSASEPRDKSRSLGLSSSGQETIPLELALMDDAMGPAISKRRR